MIKLMEGFASNNAGGISKKLPSYGPNSERTLLCTGTFTGITEVKLQISADQSNWVDVPDASFTAAGVTNVSISGAFWVRGYVNGSTDSHSINLYLGGYA